MKETRMGELQEFVMLSILSGGNRTWAGMIQKDLKESLGRSVTRGVLYVTVNRLIDKGFVISEKGEPESVRGGRSKVFFSVTQEGREALTTNKKLRESYYSSIQGI